MEIHTSPAKFVLTPNLFSRLDYTSTMKMGAVLSSETSVNFYHTTVGDIPDRNTIYYFVHETKLNSVALVRERTIPTEQQPHVGEVSANFRG
jgi:hypothetical protein